MGLRLRISQREEERGVGCPSSVLLIIARLRASQIHRTCGLKCTSQRAFPSIPYFETETAKYQVSSTKAVEDQRKARKVQNNHPHVGRMRRRRRHHQRGNRETTHRGREEWEGQQAKRRRDIKRQPVMCGQPVALIALVHLAGVNLTCLPQCRPSVPFFATAPLARQKTFVRNVGGFIRCVRPQVHAPCPWGSAGGP